MIWEDVKAALELALECDNAAAWDAIWAVWDAEQVS